MRLFYIITLLTFFVSFAGSASQKQKDNGLKKSAEVSFIYGKKLVKINTDFIRDYENLQKDFINNSVVKISYAVCFLLTFLFFLFLKNQAIHAKIIIRRLKFNYWCQFKMLYPKHVFW